MKQISLDFNRLDADGRVRIGPVAFARNAPLREGSLGPGDSVLVIDDEGNSCQGLLVEDHNAPAGYRLVVKLDLSTWVDGEDMPSLHPPSFAPAQ